MATFSKIPLSGSTNGKAINVSASATPGTTLHVAQSGTSGLDEVWLYAMNTGSAPVKLTIEYGGTNSADQIEIPIPSENGLVLVSPGLLIQNSLTISAFAATANIVSIHGFVNRVT